jgi:hypothetical protein
MPTHSFSRAVCRTTCTHVDAFVQAELDRVQREGELREFELSELRDQIEWAFEDENGGDGDQMATASAAPSLSSSSPPARTNARDSASVSGRRGSTGTGTGTGGGGASTVDRKGTGAITGSRRSSLGALRRVVANRSPTHQDAAAMERAVREVEVLQAQVQSQS